MNFFLTGLPGTGKSAAGKRAAESLNLNFLDLDIEIEKHSGKSIKELFSQGEVYFRNLETSVLQKVIRQNTKAVIALGGGAICFNDNLKIIQNSGGVLIYLEMFPDKLATRLYKPGKVNKRPMFENMDMHGVKEKIFALYNLRRSFYEQADFKIDASAPVEAVSEEIFSIIRRKNQS